MRTALCLLVVIVAGCGGASDSEPKVELPGAKAFDEANRSIVSDREGTFHGNTEASRELAKALSEMVKELEGEFFSGGKENRAVSLTGEEFLTYCQLNDDSVAFLVHVPQFKRYKGEVRDTLLELTWAVAQKITEGHPKGESLEIAIGLRGTMMYGGSATGTQGGNPNYENSFSVDKDVFFKYFEEPEAEAETSEGDAEAEGPTEANGETGDTSDVPLDENEEGSSSEGQPENSTEPATADE